MTKYNVETQAKLDNISQKLPFDRNQESFQINIRDHYLSDPHAVSRKLKGDSTLNADSNESVYLNRISPNNLKVFSSSELINSYWPSIANDVVFAWSAELLNTDSISVEEISFVSEYDWVNYTIPLSSFENQTSSAVYCPETINGYPAICVTGITFFGFATANATLVDEETIISEITRDVPSIEGSSAISFATVVNIHDGNATFIAMYDIPFNNTSSLYIGLMPDLGLVASGPDEAYSSTGANSLNEYLGQWIVIDMHIQASGEEITSVFRVNGNIIPLDEDSYVASESLLDKNKFLSVLGKTDFAVKKFHCAEMILCKNSTVESAAAIGDALMEKYGISS